MSSLSSGEIAVIVLCIIIFFVAVIILLVYVWRRYYSSTIIINGGRSRGAILVDGNAMAQLNPPPGSYRSPLRVEIIPNIQCDVYVKIVHESNSELYAHYGSSSSNPANLSQHHNDERDEMRVDEVLKDKLMGYLLYTQPLNLVRPGGYIVRVHCMRREEGRDSMSDVRQYHYTVYNEDTFVDIPTVASNGGSPLPPLGPLRPPRVVPDVGEVTDITPIKIVLVGGNNNNGDNNMSVFGNASMLSSGGRHSGREYILYSIDNTFPSIVYTGPFTLAIPKGRNSARYTIRATATDGNRASDVICATLDVLKHDTVTYDPSIPAPTAQVEAVGAMLYFEAPVEPDAIIHYQLEFEGERLYGSGGAAEDSPSKAVNEDNYCDGIQGKERLVYHNKAIEVPRDVRRIYAWTIPRGSVYEGGTSSGRSKAKESRPAIYDVALQRLVAHPKAHKASARRYNPPVMCVQCSDLFLTFDEPPVSYKLLYTLDGTEPMVGEDGTTTRQFHAGARSIDVSKCGDGAVTVTARYFTSADERGLTRFGDRFSRGFHFGA